MTEKAALLVLMGLFTKALSLKVTLIFASELSIKTVFRLLQPEPTVFKVKLLAEAVVILAYCAVGIGLESTTRVLSAVAEDIVIVLLVSSLTGSILYQLSVLVIFETANVFLLLVAAGRIKLSLPLESPIAPKV